MTGKANLLLLVSLLVACAGSPPTKEEIAQADFGPMPTNYEAPIKAYFQQVLKDPESARYEIGKPMKGYYGKTLSNLAGPRNIQFAWLVPAYVNAKNSFGGYTGKKLYHCWFRGDKLVHVIDPRKVMKQVEDSAPLPSNPK